MCAPPSHYFTGRQEPLQCGYGDLDLPWCQLVIFIRSLRLRKRIQRIFRRSTANPTTSFPPTLASISASITATNYEPSHLDIGRYLCCGNCHCCCNSSCHFCGSRCHCLVAEEASIGQNHRCISLSRLISFMRGHTGSRRVTERHARMVECKHA